MQLIYATCILASLGPGGNKITAYAGTRKIKDLDAQYRYLCKGEDCGTLPVIAFNIGIDIERYHTAYYKINEFK